MPTYTEAFQFFLDNHLNKLFQEEMDPENFRYKLYFKHYSEYVFISYKDALRNIFGQYSKKMVLPSQKPFMCLDEFKVIL